MHRHTFILILINLTSFAQEIDVGVLLENHLNKINHIYNESGYLQIYSEDILKIYVNRAKISILKCDYFKQNYPQRHRYLENNNLEVELLLEGNTARDGLIFKHTTCAQWGYLKNKRKLYFRFDRLNRDVHIENHCVWEYVIPHEVLHASYLLHSDSPEDLYIKNCISHDDYEAILEQCQLSYNLNMKKWWIWFTEDSVLYEVRDEFNDENGFLILDGK